MIILAAELPVWLTHVYICVPRHPRAARGCWLLGLPGGGHPQQVSLHALAQSGLARDEPEQRGFSTHPTRFSAPFCFFPSSICFHQMIVSSRCFVHFIATSSSSVRNIIQCLLSLVGLWWELVCRFHANDITQAMSQQGAQADDVIV